MAGGGRQVSRDFQWSFVMEPAMELGSEFGQRQISSAKSRSIYLSRASPALSCRITAYPSLCWTLMRDSLLRQCDLAGVEPRLVNTAALIRVNSKRTFNKSCAE